MSSPGFWEDAEASSKVVRELKNLKSNLGPWQAAWLKYQELNDLAQIALAQESGLLVELKQGSENLAGQLEKLEFATLLNGPVDANNAILSINAGAGGTEACDWASMLFRMYGCFCQNHGFKVKTIDLLEGEEAGIKNITVLIEGSYAYGYLKAERGVHRLVRISPFDANSRRHTSFASLDVIPEIEDDAQVKIEEKDLRIDVYRSKGAGGQSVNTTDSAVRITHIPTGIVAQCQNERSQLQNKQSALKILRSRLYELELDKREAELAKHAQEKKKIEWGSQIRSYVMHPYTMVKDHRTDCQTGDVNSIMNGKIDGFIEAYLKMLKEKK